MIFNADDSGIDVDGPSSQIGGNIIITSGVFGIDLNALGDDAVIDGNTINTSGDDGIHIDTNCENCIVDSNRITNWTNECIDDDSGTSTIGDNECS